LTYLLAVPVSSDDRRKEGVEFTNSKIIFIVVLGIHQLGQLAISILSLGRANLFRPPVHLGKDGDALSVVL